MSLYVMQHSDTKFWACALLTCAWVVAAADSAAPFAIDSLAARDNNDSGRGGSVLDLHGVVLISLHRERHSRGDEGVLKHRIDRPTD